MGGGIGDRDAHAARYYRLAEELAPQLQSDRRIQAADQLECDYEHFEQALAWLVEQRDATSATRAARMVRLLAEFWWMRGHIRAGCRWATCVLALPALAEPNEDRAMVLDAAAGLASRDGDLDADRTFHEEALAIRRALGAPLPLAQSLVHLGLGHARHAGGDRQRGWALLEEALALSREHGLGRYARRVLFDMTQVALDHGDYASARTCVREILTGLRGSADEWAAGAVFELAGALAAQQGDAERALRLAAAGRAQQLAAGMTEQGEYGAWLDHLLDPARNMLDAASQARVCDEGRAMTREQAFAEALGGDDA